MRKLPISTTRAKTGPTISFGVLFFAAILAVGIPSASAEEITPNRHLYNYGGGGNVTTWLGIAASWNGRVFKNPDGFGEVITNAVEVARVARELETATPPRRAGFLGKDRKRVRSLRTVVGAKPSDES